ncbi:hypothetical protein QWY90_09035 [Flavobacterium paronense]|uniref:Outer membrane protein beta-barrel domain-containing protein n=1 Tax=Flavobacterium paronense TaxID=1392775 RepID=A0ABV5GAK0_9FLAO|nr:hypothetical protein [Flavobacterium paronense]MDN3677462.1 hypothetical protein [Flavobacterium paronense]
MKITTKIKLVSVFAVSMFFTNVIVAQETEVKNYDQKFKLGFGINAGTVFDDPYEYSLGADARLQYDLSKRYSVTLTSGFTNLFVNGEDNDLGFIPVKAGFKAFIFKDTFYLMGEIGAAFAVTNDYNKNSLLLAPSIGYATKYIDISLRYERYNDFPNYNDNKIGKGVGQLGLRLAYGFEL